MQAPYWKQVSCQAGHERAHTGGHSEGLKAQTRRRFQSGTEEEERTGRDIAGFNGCIPQRYSGMSLKLRDWNAPFRDVKTSSLDKKISWKQSLHGGPVTCSTAPYVSSQSHRSLGTDCISLSSWGCSTP
ncbi:unnamed protein product [Lota lota]